MESTELPQEPEIILSVYIHLELLEAKLELLTLKGIPNSDERNWKTYQAIQNTKKIISIYEDSIEGM